MAMGSVTGSAMKELMERWELLKLLMNIRFLFYKFVPMAKLTNYRA